MAVHRVANTPNKNNKGTQHSPIQKLITLKDLVTPKRLLHRNVVITIKFNFNVLKTLQQQMEDSAQKIQNSR
jgi:hypothetical protein